MKRETRILRGRFVQICAQSRESEVLVKMRGPYLFTALNDGTFKPCVTRPDGTIK